MSAAATTAPLAGVRVVAIEHAVAGPFCSRQLADLGAEVIKVERPAGGDFARGYDGMVHGESAYFVWLNHGKQSIALDLATADGRTLLDRLLAEADVLVSNLGPGALDRMGYGWSMVAERWPRLISCEITGFGADGPYSGHKAFDLLLQGESGLLSITGSGDVVARVGISIADIAAGTHAVAAVLGALLERVRTDRGRHLEISMLECLADWLAVPALQARYTGHAPPRTGLHHPSIAPYGAYRTGDGSVILLAVQTGAQWQRFCDEVLRRPAVAADERFATNERRVAHRAELDAVIGRVLDDLDSGELARRLEAADVPYGALNAIGDLIAHPQLQARDRWLTVTTPSGSAVVPRPVLGTPRRATVPALDEDGEAIRAAVHADHEPVIG